MSELHDQVFLNSDSLPSQELRKFAIHGVEKIREDLVAYQDYDGVTPIATVALEIKDGHITQSIFHMEGETDPKRIETSIIFGASYKGGKDHCVRVPKLNLSRLRWRGSLVSD